MYIDPSKFILKCIHSSYPRLLSFINVPARRSRALFQHRPIHPYHCDPPTAEGVYLARIGGLFSREENTPLAGRASLILQGRGVTWFRRSSSGARHAHRTAATTGGAPPASSLSRARASRTSIYAEQTYCAGCSPGEKLVVRLDSRLMSHRQPIES